MVRNLTFLLIFLVFVLQSFSQTEDNAYIDSLSTIYNTTKEDTLKIQSLLMLSEIYYRTNPDTLLSICEDALSFIEKKLKSKPTPREREIFLANKGTAYTNMAAVFEEKGDLKKSFEYNNKGLAVYKSINYFIGISTVLNNLGKIMKLQGEFKEAINLYTESIKYADLCNDRKGKAYTIGNIGAIHYSNGNYNEALEYFIKAKVMHKEVNDIYGLTVSLNNIGSVYRNLNMLDLALKSYHETYGLCLQSGDIKQQSNCTLKLSMVYGLKNDQVNAIKFGDLALKYAKDSESAQSLVRALKNLYDINKRIKNTAKALLYYEEFIVVRDSINTEDNQKAIIEQRIQMDYDRKLIADSIQFEEKKKAELTVKNVEIEQGKNQRMMLYGGLSIFVLLSIFIFNRYQISQKQAKIISEQKNIVESQKMLVEEKNKEITDSINYAKRIQTAILPSLSSFESQLPNSFILYKPKDIVAGDFYWMETTSSRHSELDTESFKKEEIASEARKDVILFAAADCTGHGVPGALVSVVCSNALNRSLKELNTSNPALILDRTRDIIINQFSKNDEQVSDGMDIALCSFNKDTLELQFAGANNSLYIIRNNEMLEYAAHREPVGLHHKQTPFISHNIQLQKNDTIYLFTDGYADQFGGENGKKLKYKPFKELLLTISHHPIKEQNVFLNKHFSEWKGDFEQVDDVCIIGVKI